MGPTGSSTNLPQAFRRGDFHWVTRGPVAAAAATDGENWHALKDPSVVRHQDQWHLFSTVRGKVRTHGIVYSRFADWPAAAQAKPQLLPIHPGYFCAPQVFYFTPQQRWYLICQASDKGWQPEYQPAWSVTTNLAQPESWSRLVPMFERAPGIKAWLDFWVICDPTHAHLFYTSLDGKMWRMETPLARFPLGWSQPVLALEGDVFEASHTYRLQGTGVYLTLIEAQNGEGWRYYKAYLAERLAGPWQPMAAERDHAFASMRNVRQPDGRWTDVVSHGELLRAGVDEKLEVDPRHLRFLIQGVLDRDRAGLNYGQIPWQLGLLEPAGATDPRR
jgi:hypothetical protein